MKLKKHDHELSHRNMMQMSCQNFAILLTIAINIITRRVVT